MKSVLHGIGAMFIISFIAWAATGTFATTSGEQFVSQNNSVRLD